MITAERLERVTRFDGGTLPVISVYLALEKDRRSPRSLPAKLSSVLHQIRPMPASERKPTGRAFVLAVLDEYYRALVLVIDGDVIDELAQTVIDTSGTVGQVAADTLLTQDAGAVDLRIPPPSPAVDRIVPIGGR